LARYRVYEIAREFDLSSEALVKILLEIGIDVKSHMSSIDEAAVEKIREKFTLEKEVMKERDEQKRALAEERKKSSRKGRGAVKEQPVASKPTSSKGVNVKKSVPPPKAKRGRGASKKRHRKVNQREIEENIKRTLSLITGKQRRRKKKKEVPAESTAPEGEANLVKVSEFISVAELSNIIDVSPSTIISTCMEVGLMVTINQRLDFDTISLVCGEFGYKAEPLEEYGMEEIEHEEVMVEDLRPRPPIVTVMGHVDHGKTSLLDYIRKTNVIAGERGGITQHIGAYLVNLPQGTVTFLDTPGHEAFTAMRARGAKVTDVVVLVIAADDRVMPQTIEAIDHAKAAAVPMIVAINKIDLPAANPDRVKQDLMNYGIVVEEYGGEILCAEVSAKKGTGIEHLLELVLLQAEMLELKASPKGDARGVVIESRLDKGMGPVATVLITRGILHPGDNFICGLFSGKVRAILNERGSHIEYAGPARPVQVLGFSGVCQAGDNFYVMKDERGTRAISSVRQRLKREHGFRRKRTTLEDIYNQVKRGELKSLRLVIKADVDGSVEALTDSLQKISTDEVAVDIIHRGVGSISETDILLAAASDAVVIGFHVKPDAGARAAIAREKVDVRLYQVIYEVVSNIRAAMEGMLTPAKREIHIGMAQVKEVFSIPRIGTIAGCLVDDGLVKRDAKVRVSRSDEVVYEGEIASLKRFKDDVREVAGGLECGIAIEGFKDIHVGDTLEFFVVEEIKRKL
jgi:translation initiation factor IF-2